MKSIKGLSFYNSEGSLIDVEELYARVQQLEQDRAIRIIVGETDSATSTTSSDIDELAGTETDISLTNADDFKAGDMGISVVTVTDRNNSHGFMVFLALADEPDQPAGTLHVRFITGIYNGKDGEDYLFYSQVTDDTQAPYVGKSYSISSTYFNREQVVDDTFLMMVHDTNTDISYLCSAKVISETAAQILDIMELGGSSKTILPVIYSPISIQLDAIKSRITTGSQDYYYANNLSDFSNGDIGIVNANIHGIEESGTVAGKLIILVTDAGGGAIGQMVGGRTIGYTYTPSGDAKSGIQQNEVINRTQSVDFANANTADFVEISGAVWAKMLSGDTGTIYTISSATAMDTPTLPSATFSRCRQIGDNAYIFTDNSKQPCVKFDMLTEQLTNTSFTMSQAFNPYTMQIAEINDKIYVLSSSDIVEVSESGTDVSQTTYSWSGTAPTMSYASSAEYGNFVYVFGGVNSSVTGMSSSITKIDILNKSATTLSVSLPKALGLSSAITVGSNIYIFGGATAFEGDQTDILSDSIYKFDAETETISTLDCVLSGARSGMTLCAKGTSIYLIGGERANEKTNKIYEFDTVSETLYDTGVVCPYNNSDGSCASTDTAIYKFLGDDTGGGEKSYIITKISLSTQSSSGFDYKRLALYSEIGNGGGGTGGSDVIANPSNISTPPSKITSIGINGTKYALPSTIIDLGTVNISFGQEASVETTISQDVSNLLKATENPAVKITTSNGFSFIVHKAMEMTGGNAFVCEILVEQNAYWLLNVFVNGTEVQVQTKIVYKQYVEANPSTEATATLTKLTVQGGVNNEKITYEIPQGAKVVDGGSFTISGMGTSEITLSSDVVAQLVAEDVIGAKFDVAGADLLFNRTIYEPAAGSVSYTTATFECMTLALTGSTATSIAVGVRSNSTTATLVVTEISSGGGDNGIPSGGLAGQALTKQSGTDYDVAWTSINTSEPTVITEAAYAEALAAGTIENDKLYYIQGTSDDTLNVSQTAEDTSYNNATSGLTATNVQDAIDELKENEFSGSYNDLTDKPTIPTLNVASIATALGLTTTQLNNLITFAKSITSASTSGTTVNNEFTAQSFDTTA